jgi:hypothetical protein
MACGWRRLCSGSDFSGAALFTFSVKGAVFRFTVHDAQPLEAQHLLIFSDIELFYFASNLFFGPDGMVGLGRVELPTYGLGKQ